MNPEITDQDKIPAYANRNQSFGEGMVHGQVAAPQSLQEEAARYGAQVPTEYRPSGSLNGMAADQYEATIGGSLAVQNGSASDTWRTKKFFTAND